MWTHVALGRLGEDLFIYVATAYGADAILSAMLGWEGPETKGDTHAQCLEYRTTTRTSYEYKQQGKARAGCAGDRVDSMQKSKFAIQKLTFGHPGSQNKVYTAGVAVPAVALRAQQCRTYSNCESGHREAEATSEPGHTPDMLGVLLRTSPHLADTLVSAWTGVALTLVSWSRLVRSSGSSSLAARLARSTFSWWRCLGLRRTPPSTPSCRSLAEE